MFQDIKFRNRSEADAYLDSMQSAGLSVIGGVDEVGRGSLAAETVAGCVVLPLDHGIKGIKDSKRLSARRRQELSLLIKERAICYGIGSADESEIDQLNIQKAACLAAKRAVDNCRTNLDYVFCDGGLYIEDLISFQTQSFIKGDNLFECIGAASIIAKVWRDDRMAEYDKVWPEYGFTSNCGYGTKAHIEAIKQHGISPIHRKSFGICRQFR